MYEMAEKIGLDSAVSPRLAIANQIIGFVRSHKTKEDKGITNFYKIADSVEAIEFTVKEDFAHINKPLRSLVIKSNALIGGIVRDEQFILPTGETSIQAGDMLIVVTDKKQINDLTEIFR